MKQTTDDTFTIKVFKNGKLVRSARPKTKRRFLSYISQNKRLKNDCNKYIKVSYGYKKDYKGQIVEFYNDGAYTSIQELKKVARIFCEEI